MECNEKLNIHQINKLDVNDLKRKDIFPITVTSAVFDKQGNSLEALLACNNFLFLPFKGSGEATRLTVLILLRRKGLILSYTNYDNETIIEQYIGDSKSDKEWTKDSNWQAPFSKDIQNVVDESINKRFSSAIFGLTVDRPTNVTPGFMYFDNTLGKPIWAKSISSDNVITWVDATGITV